MLVLLMDAVLAPDPRTQIRRILFPCVFRELEYENSFAPEFDLRMHNIQVNH